MSNTTSKDTKEKKVRVFTLAKELNVPNPLLLDYCKELGFTEITNQLNGLLPDQVEALKERVKKGPKAGAGTGAAHTPVHAPAAPAKPVIPPVAKTIQALPKAPPKPAAKPAEPVAPPVVAAPAPSVATEVAPEPEPVAPAPAPAVVAETPAKPAAPAAPAVPAGPPKNFIPALGGAGMRNLSGRPAPVAAKPAAPATPTAPAAAAAPPTPEVTPVAAEAKPAPVEVPAPAPTPVAAASPSPAAPVPAPTVQVPPTPPAPPKNIIPANAGQPARPNVLSRAPAPPPPKHIAAPRTGGGAPPPGSQRPMSGATARPVSARPARRDRVARPVRRAPDRPARPNRTGAAGPPKGAAPSVKLTPEMIDRLRAASARGQRVSMAEIARTPAAQPGTPPKPGDPARPGGPPRPGAAPGFPPRPGEVVDDEEEKKKAGVIGRDSRHRGRAGGGRGGSGGGPRVDRGSVVMGPGGVEMVEQQWGSRRGPRQALLRKALRGKIAPIIKEGKIEIGLPITVRSLSDAIGMKVVELSKRLMKETNQLYGNNSPVDFDTAALIAVEKNIELVVKRQKTAEEVLIEDFEKMMENVDPEKLQPRPPVVTIMGHVDHGKTSLLDKIRRSNVAAGEVGGITQVIRAWSVTHKIEDPETGEKVIERPITFLDTPGHEAFTKMRARGANVTDIAVIVVAATDGVMPQTEEAVAHARAADVRIVVAINKVDVPNANVDRTRRQLYNLELLPDDMGGDIQFVETSALTGQGIDDLLERDPDRGGNQPRRRPPGRPGPPGVRHLPRRRT